MKGLVKLPLVAAALLLAGCPWIRRIHSDPQPAHPQLELVAAWLLDQPAPLEPSGLVMRDGLLYTVADKDDRTIYRVETGADAARLVPAIRFTPPDRGPMDWEGITVDAAGAFYLVSEERGRILCVTPDGRASWSSPDIRASVAGAGFFSKDNAGFEGIAWLGPNHWLGAVEREPRGLVEWRGTGPAAQVSATDMDHSPFNDALPFLRLPDYSGLDTDAGAVYALFRNAHLVVRLERDGAAWRETQAWSYRHIETDPRWAYRSQTYGQAEGLAVDGGDVYLIFDNNLGGRQSDANDGRPLLVRARFPAGS